MSSARKTSARTSGSRNAGKTGAGGAGTRGRASGAGTAGQDRNVAPDGSAGKAAPTAASGDAASTSDAPAAGAEAAKTDAPETSAAKPPEAKKPAAAPEGATEKDTATTLSGAGQVAGTALQNAPRIAEETVKMTTDSLESAVRDTQDAYGKGLENGAAAAKDHLSRTGDQFRRSWEDTSSQTQETLQAWVSSNTALIRGSEELAKAWMEVSQSFVDRSISTMQSIMTAGSVSEIVDLQSTYAKNTFDMMVAETTRMSELSLKSANEAMAPLNGRVNAAMERMGTPIAA